MAISYEIEDRVNRLVNQYTFSSVLKQLIRTYSSEAIGSNSVGECINSFANFFDIDKAHGSWLDIIGAIVGQPRLLIDIITHPYFGFEGHPQAEPFDKGLFYCLADLLAGNRVLTDEEYRILIKAKIMTNNHVGTVQNTIDIFEAVFGVECTVTDLTFDYTVFIDKQLQQWEINLIENTGTLPKVKGFYRILANKGEPISKYFGFKDVKDVYGFDDGTFASITNIPSRGNINTKMTKSNPVMVT